MSALGKEDLHLAFRFPYFPAASSFSFLRPYVRRANTLVFLSSYSPSVVLDSALSKYRLYVEQAVASSNLQSAASVMRSHMNRLLRRLFTPHLLGLAAVKGHQLVDRRAKCGRCPRHSTRGGGITDFDGLELASIVADEEVRLETRRFAKWGKKRSRRS